MSEENRRHLEADRIALYVVGRHAGEREKALFAKAMEALKPRLTDPEKALWDAMVRSRRTMAWADAGLALIRPSSVIRRQLLVMVAILETSPQFAEHFLPRRCPPRKALGVAGAALRSAFRGVAGLVVVKAARV